MVMRGKIPITKGLYTNSDALETADFATALDNIFITKAGANIKRPGLVTGVDTGTTKPVEGIYWFNEASYALAVSNGKVFKITKSGGTYYSEEMTGSTLRNYTATGGVGRATFTDDGTRVYIANGGAINYHVAASSTAQPLSDGDAPTTVSHVAFMNQRVIANVDGTSKFQWSDVGNGLSWTATSWATAEGDADWILALHVGFKEIVLFGEQSIENWYDDGTTPFAPIPGAYIQRGISSQDSVQFHNGTWIFQDQNNNICTMTNRTVSVVSTPIEKEMRELGNITDGLSSLLSIAGDTYYVISYPTANRTFVWKVGEDSLDGWSEMKTSSARWLGQCHAYSPTWGSHLVGSKTDGKIMVCSTAVYDDLGGAITSTRRTGWIDHGTPNWKNSLALYVKAKDAVNGSVTAPVLKVRYRDNGSATWSSWRTMSMTGDATKKLYQLGRYRTRQWEFQNEQACLLDIVSIDEDLEVMTG